MSGGGVVYLERGSEDSELPLEDPLAFSPSDGAYRVWLSLRILPAFFIVVSVQGLLALGIFTGSLALFRHPSYWSQDGLNETWMDGETGAWSGGALVKSGGGGGGLPLLFLEPWEGLAWLRLLVSLLQILALGVGLYGVWLQRGSLLLPHLASTVLGILSALVYVMLLTWHSVKFEDYFAFCFAGLTLLLILIANVLGVHAAMELYHYFRDLKSFLRAARKRWPEAAKAAQLRPQTFPAIILFKHYRLSRALIRLAAEERAALEPLNSHSLCHHDDSL